MTAPKFRVIAFTGEKGNGKDTASEVLRKHPYGFVHMNFADPVRKICKEMFCLTDDEMSKPELKEKPLERWPFKSPRELMQGIAQICRDLWPGIWVKHLDRRINSVRDYCASYETALEGVVVTDLRYPDEVLMLREQEAQIFKVVNPRVERNEHSNHPSEQHFDEIHPDYIILNNGTIESLHEVVRSFIPPARPIANDNNIS